MQSCRLRQGYESCFSADSCQFATPVTGGASQPPYTLADAPDAGAREDLIKLAAASRGELAPLVERLAREHPVELCVVALDGDLLEHHLAQLLVQLVGVHGVVRAGALAIVPGAGLENPGLEVEYFGMILTVGDRNRMHFQFTEPARETDVIGVADVLIAEEDDLPGQ